MPFSHSCQDIEQARNLELGVVTFWVLSWYKLLVGLLWEFPVRTGERLLLMWTAIVDHWPCDYEAKLRSTAQRYAEDRARRGQPAVTKKRA